MIPKAQALNLYEDFPPARNFSDIASLLNILIPATFIIAALITMFMLIVASFRFVTAGGDQENIEKTKKIYKYSILGLVIIMIGYLVVKLLGRIFNVDFYL